MKKKEKTGYKNYPLIVKALGIIWEETGGFLLKQKKRFNEQKNEIDEYLETKASEVVELLDKEANGVTLKTTEEPFKLAVSEIVTKAKQEILKNIKNRYEKPSCKVVKALNWDLFKIPVLEIFNEKLLLSLEKKYGQKFETIRNYTNHIVREVLEGEGLEGEDDIL
jgi:hypothetical protein